MKQIIRLAFLCSFLTLLGCTPVNKSQVGGKVSVSQLELIDWMTSYYKNPSPKEFPNWLKELSSEGLLKDEKKQFPFLGFAATVFEANADQVPEWIRTIDVLPQQDRKTVLIALWLSNTEESHNALSDISRNNLLQTHNYFNLQTQRLQFPPSLDTIDKYWGGLDIQWGRFLASGAKKPIINITSVLELASFLGSNKKYPKPETKDEKWARINEVLFTTAMRSLRSNCKRHPKVLEICEQIYEEGKLDRLAQWSLKSVLIEMKPDKYKIEVSSNQVKSVDVKSKYSA
ncbi:MAG: hypothetical protein JEZ12_23795 [Desulfobacterium sp.]|nr:hypothetical protein [Desulfobacterium sp.]